MTEPLLKSPERGSVLWWWAISLEIAFMLVLVASIVGGVWLWRGERRGVLLSRVVQALQVLSLQVGGTAYQLIIGAAALITAEGGEVGFKLQVGSDVRASWNPDVVGFAVAFNVLAFAMLVLLVTPTKELVATINDPRSDHAV